jgi:YggT family protein
MSGLLAVGYFLTSILFSTIIFVIWCRIALRYLLVSSLHPIAQILNRLSDPIILPITRLMKTPRYRHYDWSALIVLIIIEIMQFVVLGLFALHTWMPIPLVLIYTLADLIVQPCSLLFYVILIRVILSWVSPNLNNPLSDIIYRISDPLINYTRRYIPVIAGIDFSAWAILICLKAVQLFISASLPLHLI